MTDFNDTSWQIEPSRGPRPFSAGDIVMENWEVVRRIGAGGYGTVYEIRKNQMGVSVSSAMKVISIPHEPGFADSLRSMGASDQQVATTIRGQVDRAVNEIRAMMSLVNYPSVVRCEDFSVVQYEDDGSWEIFIRMELLTPLTAWTRKNPVTQDWVRQIGASMAQLLQLCEERKIMHRDIKPANVFIDPLGNAKLGDFGLARQLAANSSTHSHGVGTDAYMAPEVAMGEHYDTRADIYSLGLLLYWLLNGQSLPFMGPDVDFGKSVAMRLAGTPLPRIAGVEDGLMDAVLQACAFKQDDRFQSGAALRAALTHEAAAPRTPVPPAEPVGDEWKAFAVEHVSAPPRQGPSSGPSAGSDDWKAFAVEHVSAPPRQEPASRPSAGSGDWKAFAVEHVSAPPRQEPASRPSAGSDDRKAYTAEHASSAPQRETPASSGDPQPHDPEPHTVPEPQQPKKETDRAALLKQRGMTGLLTVLAAFLWVMTAAMCSADFDNSATRIALIIFTILDILLEIKLWREQRKSHWLMGPTTVVMAIRTVYMLVAIPQGLTFGDFHHGYVGAVHYWLGVASLVDIVVMGAVFAAVLIRETARARSGQTPETAQTPRRPGIEKRLWERMQRGGKGQIRMVWVSGLLAFLIVILIWGMVDGFAF